MDINETLAKLKQEPGFGENVGMVLVHNGVVRAWSRKDRDAVDFVEVTADTEKIAAICAEIEARDGIFRVLAEAYGGVRRVGDDLLHLVVAGDVRENVLSAMTDLLNRVKAEAVSKTEAVD
jgi:molybdopterin synthase catalytic subunit